MTLIVGITCSDGVVIATDECMQNVPDRGARQRVMTNKWVFNLDCDWVCAWSGHRASIVAGRMIDEYLEGLSGRVPPRDFEKKLEAIGDQAFDKAATDEERKSNVPRSHCLIAYDHGNTVPEYENSVRLYELAIQRASTYHRIQTYSYRFIGDSTNPAAWWGDSFVFKKFSIASTTNEMAFLAGHVVLAGHHFNSQAVDGLAIMLVQPGNSRILNHAEIELIKRQSVDIHEKTESLVLEACQSRKLKGGSTPSQ